MKRTDPSVLQSLTFTSMYTTEDPGVQWHRLLIQHAWGPRLNPKHRTEQKSKTVLFAYQDDHTKQQLSLNSLASQWLWPRFPLIFSYFHSYILELILETLNQWFSATFPHVVVTPSDEIISFLHPNCDFAIVMNCNISIWHALPVKESFDSKRSQPTGSEPRFKPKCLTLTGKNTHQYITSGFLDKEIIYTLNIVYVL